VSDNPCCFERLDLWHDPVARDGPHNMAVDEWLLEQVGRPLLRIYRWAGDWASCGCFVPLAAVRREFPETGGVRLVRRWTGGEIVDHRGDWTYSLIVPQARAGDLGRPRESYRRIHAALARALELERVSARLAPVAAAQADGHGACFRNPVAGDLLGADDSKQAGAAQRRTRRGLLHQGSVRVVSAATVQRTRCFAAFLAAELDETSGVAPDMPAVQGMVEARYGRADWLGRR